MPIIRASCAWQEPTATVDVLPSRGENVGRAAPALRLSLPAQKWISGLNRRQVRSTRRLGMATTGAALLRLSHKPHSEEARHHTIPPPSEIIRTQSVWVTRFRCPAGAPPSSGIAKTMNVNATGSFKLPQVLIGSDRIDLAGRLLHRH
jgi:hypothetical protein